jgi:hypothetical protein
VVHSAYRFRAIHIEKPDDRYRLVDVFLFVWTHWRSWAGWHKRDRPREGISFHPFRFLSFVLRNGIAIRQ